MTSIKTIRQILICWMLIFLLLGATMLMSKTYGTKMENLDNQYYELTGNHIVTEETIEKAAETEISVAEQIETDMNNALFTFVGRTSLASLIILTLALLSTLLRLAHYHFKEKKAT